MCETVVNTKLISDTTLSRTIFCMTSRENFETCQKCYVKQGGTMHDSIERYTSN